MIDLTSYHDFIASKGVATKSSGFVPGGLHPRLFDHQRLAVEYALGKGRAALFLNTGLGKSGIEAVFADQARAETNRPSLILTPLAVANQMQRECADFGVEAKIVREDEDVWPGVNIANYERLPKLDPTRFGGVVLDESSILKAFTGQTKRALVEAFKETPYRLAATATPAPNDHMEIGQHSEWLGVMPGPEMMARWFITDQTEMGKYRLKGHAARSFWQWVASWARAATLPSDIGGCDDGFILPPLTTRLHTVGVDLLVDADEGMLFRIPDNSATSMHQEKRRTLTERVACAAEIANSQTDPVVVWCERNDESKALVAAIPDAIEVEGSMTLDKKEAALDDFTFGRVRVLVTKPKLAGFGLNWQHAQCQVFASLSHSYEQFYQAVRRSWRYGQKGTVTAHVVIAETEHAIWRNIQRKGSDHERMKVAMALAMKDAQQGADLRVAYTRGAGIDLPQFMERRT